MADDVTLPGTGTAVAADEIGGKKHQRVKVQYGDDGSATDVSAVNPMPVTVSNANANGEATAANSAPVVLASDKHVRTVNGADEYETVAASQTDQVIGPTGASGDRLSHITIQPATTTPGTVIVKDGTTVIYTFPSGQTLPAALPFTVVFGIRSVNGAFKITTGADISCMAVGDFT